MEKPLAIKLAPNSINEVVGQTHLIGKGKILSNLVENKKLFSMILYGDPGIGKTSIANAIVKDIKVRYRFLNATINNKKDIETVIEEAKMYDGIVLIMDEIHRLNKDKQDILLPTLESGLVTLIGLTTSNPYHAINPAIRSRCQIFKLEPLNEEDIIKALKKAIKTDYLKGIDITSKELKVIAKKAKFDLRFAYNLLEVCYYSTKEHKITTELIESINNSPVLTSDKNETSHYDNLSGLQKSIRGSDADAALFYLAKLLTEGDLDSISRRLSVIVYEDIGLANPSLGPKLQAAIQAAERVGIPEANLCFAPIVIEMALSPKSNSAYLALDKAMTDLNSKNVGDVPNIIKSPYTGYLYPHNYKYGIVKQTYLPKNIENEHYYIAKETSKYEQTLKMQKEKIEQIKNK